MTTLNFHEDLFSLVDISLALVVTVSGLGLLAGRRWAWFSSMFIALAGLVLGVNLALGGGDISNIGTVPVAVFFVILPTTLLIAPLLAPRTTRWLRRQSQRHT